MLILYKPECARAVHSPPTLTVHRHVTQMLTVPFIPLLTHTAIPFPCRAHALPQPHSTLLHFDPQPLQTLRYTPLS
jgi:hypothetical protein